MATNTAGVKAWRDRNREYFNAQQRAYRATRKEIKRAQSKARYIMNRDAILKQQAVTRAKKPAGYQAQRSRDWRFSQRNIAHPMPNACEICANPRGVKNLYWDHNHVTEQHRGWLCNRCNLAIGQFRDNPALLRAAVVYLERTADKVSAELREDQSR